MKKLRKMTSILLAVVMMLALSVTAFADTDQKAGETYEAYKIFDATISGDNASYSISADSAWLTDVQNYNGTGLTLTKSADGTKYVVTTSENFSAKAFAEYLATKKDGKPINGSVTGTKEGATFTDLADGYYLVSSSLGNVCQLTTGGEIKIVEKNTVPDVDKKIETKDAYAQIGQVIPFTVTITDGTGTNKEIILHDQMSDGLTLNKDSFKIQVNGEDVDSANYVLETENAGNDTFQIQFKEAYVASLNKGDKIVVTYSATVNKNAVKVDKVTNKASIDYSEQSNTDTSEVEVKTNSFDVLKYAKGDSKKANLAGATFQLKQGDTVIKLIKVDENTYRVAEADEEGAVDTFTTVDAKNITIQGVDSDLEYTLVETVAPDGYNLLTSPVTVKVNADNSTVSEIENSAGATLPTTGGMGTTVLYAVGIILVLGAGVTLVVRRRMGASK